MMPKPLVLPEGLENLPVRVQGNSAESFEGTVFVKKWSHTERRARAMKRTLKIVGSIFACSLIGLFVHILLLVIIPTLCLTMLAVYPLLAKFMGEDATFFKVESQCPYCKSFKTLRPYLDTQFKPQVTVQCPDCGQTAQAFLQLAGS